MRSAPIFHAVGNIVFHFDAVNDDFNVVGLIAVEHHAIFQFAQLAVNTDFGESGLADVVEQFAIMAFAPAD